MRQGALHSIQIGGVVELSSIFLESVVSQRVQVVPSKTRDLVESQLRQLVTDPLQVRQGALQSTQIGGVTVESIIFFS